MTKEKELADNEQSEAEDSGNSEKFFTWVLRQIYSWQGVAFLLVAGVTTGYNVITALEIYKVEVKWHLPILYSTQMGIVLIISAIMAFKKPSKPDTQHTRGDKAVKQFGNWWALLWISWFVLYGGLTSWTIYQAILPEGIWPATWDSIVPATKLNTIEPVVNIIHHFLNNLSSLILFMLFHILAYSSVVVIEGENTDDTDKKYLRVKSIFWVALFFVCTMLETGLILSSYSNNHDRAISISIIFGIVYGVLAATALALVIGRLDSNLLGVPKWAIIILFIYAGIQPSFDFVLKESKANDLIRIVQEIILVVALLCKIMLFAVMLWLIKTNRLLYYMVKYYEMEDTVVDDRKQFLQDLLDKRKTKTKIKKKNNNTI